MSYASTANLPKITSMFLTMTMALSGVVLIEPAPFDVFTAIFFVVLVLCGRFYLPRPMHLPLGLLALFLFFNCASATSALDDAAMAKFLIVNVYMVVIFLSIAAAVYTWRDGAQILLGGYLTSCVLIGCISLFAFFVGPRTDLLFVFDRLKGTFKDPNVFGPFMVMGVIYCVSLMENCKRGAKLFYFLCLVVLLLCVVLSASRGGWVNLAASMLLYLAARSWQGAWSGASIRKVAFLFLILGAAGGAVTVAVDHAEFGDFLAMRAQMQGYDESRFAVQAIGVQWAMNKPLGYGPGQFEVELGSTAWTGSRGAHSLFVRILFENGIGGFLSLMAFLGASLVVAVRLATSRWRFSTVACISASSLIGSIVNSAVIDTLHWRHFWIQLGITWGLYVVYRRESQAVRPAPDDLELNARRITTRQVRQQSLRRHGLVGGVAAGRAGCRRFFV